MFQSAGVFLCCVCCLATDHVHCCTNYVNKMKLFDWLYTKKFSVREPKTTTAYPTIKKNNLSHTAKAHLKTITNNKQ